MSKAIANFFLVNRALLHSDRWLKEPFSRGQAWVDLFGLANHQPGHFRVRGIRIDVKRGQLAYSQASLAERWKWSRGKVRRYLSELEKGGDIVQQNTEVTTVITIVSYDTWQSASRASSGAGDTADGQQTDSRRTADGTHTNKKEKKEKKDNSNTLSGTGGKSKNFIPPTLEEVQTYIQANNYEVDAQKFIWHYSKLGWKNANGKPVRNWKQTLIQVWVKRHEQDRTAKGKRADSPQAGSREGRAAGEPATEFIR